MNTQETLARGIAYCEKYETCEQCPLDKVMCINNCGKLIVRTHDFLEFAQDFNDMIKEIYK